MVEKLNPNHQTLQELEGQWQKLLVLAVFKAGGVIDITDQDIARSQASGGLFLTVDGRANGIKLKLVDEKTARKLAKEAGGLPN